jgi:hypothetical protein
MSITSKPAPVRKAPVRLSDLSRPQQEIIRALLAARAAAQKAATA